MPAWWFDGKLLWRRNFWRVRLKGYHRTVPFPRSFDRFVPWRGRGLIAVARRPDASVGGGAACARAELAAAG